MKALITGGAGFIGSHLAEYLLTLDHEVAVIDDLSTGNYENIRQLLKYSNFRFAIDSITSEIVMDHFSKDCDIIFHLAAAVGVDLIVKDPVHVIETNILGTQMVLKIAKRYRKKTVIASTSEIYGKSENTPYFEDDDRIMGPTTKSRWCYATSKAVDEFLAMAYQKQDNVPVVIVRLFNTIGPRQTGQYGMVVPRFISQALQGKDITVYGDGKQSRCFCNVKDTVRAIIALSECENAVGSVYNIGSTEPITILELAERVLRLVAKAKGGSLLEETMPKQAIRFVPYAEAYEEGFEDMRQRVPDISRIKDLVGWTPDIPLNETLKEILNYMHS